MINDEKKEINKKEKEETQKRKFSKSEMILLVIMSLLIGVCIGGLFRQTNIITKTTTYTNKYVKELVENYEYIINNYYSEINEQDLVNSAISGMMESLDDPYSTYFNQADTDNFTITLDGSYEGIGVQVAKDEESGEIIVVAVLKNSPALESGVKAGDKILAIDDIEASKISVEEFSEFIKTSNKKKFKIKIKRDNEIIDINITRKNITLDSITSEVIEKNNKKIGYIYIGIFANNTYFQFKDALDELEKQKIDSLIIDVRDNTGGHLTAVDSILDIFLTEKQKLYGFEKNKKTTYVYGTGNSSKEYEIVLLGNELSASASEVLIAGLRENLNSKFFGKKTYGKGTVQELVTLSDGTQYKITIKKWLTPKGNWINDTKGIEPDKVVELDDKYFETFKREDDTQLNYAIEYLIK